MTTELQGPQPPVSPAEAAVACAIWCCDQQEYKLPNTRGGRKTCQRLGHRKHSCVLHKLREKKGGKLTTNTKVKGVEASPQIKNGTRGNDTGRTLIPDTIVDGKKIIDAKFPCETESVHAPGNTPPGTGPGFTSGSGTRAYPSDARLGSAMGTPKEAIDYKKIDGGMPTECMTPADAAAKKGENCKCEPSDAAEEEEEEEDE